MIIYCTETLKFSSETEERSLLNQMGKIGWILSCVSITDKTSSESFSAKYYFYKEIPNY